MGEKFEHKKSLGQNFLNSDYVPKKMCAAASLETGDVVLEIGPGTGALTKELLARGATVIALEADIRAVEALKLTFAPELAAAQLTLHHHDARTLDVAQFGLKNQEFKVVANIPYYLSGFLFRNLLEAPIQPKNLVFLVQKEVATRICKDKKESLLSLSVKAYGKPTYICTVKRGHFTPPPKVDSAIVAISGISKDAFKNISEAVFFEILHLGFGQKRKQLLGNLSTSYSRDYLTKVFENLDISPTVRAEDIPLSAWVTLVTELQKNT